VTFVDFATTREICDRASLAAVSQRSFPFPRTMGRWWIYNEFVTIATRR
jgi:hypothetical protein